MKLRTLILFVLAVVCFAGKALAIPAYHHPIKYTQPDGSVITIVGHGDEHLSFVTTTDGYTIVKDAKGFYRYAAKENGKLIPTNYLAHDKELRSAAEENYLAGMVKFTKPEQTAEQVQMQENKARMAAKPMLAGKEPSKINVNTENFHGLVILVNFTDQKFRLGDQTNSYYDDMINGENYRGFDDPELGWQDYTGSIKDYFRDNSNGKFVPEFDVVGPIEVNYSKYDMKKNSNLETITRSVLQKAGEQVNFSDYDADNDGVVDMFYVIYAGYGSHFGGNDERLLWPCASWMGSYKLQGMSFSRYASSTELFGNDTPNNILLDGIGVITHEFSHVLGFMDHYDVNYNDYENPDEWDVMAAGSYFNNSRTPVGYSAYERLSAGFIGTPTINNRKGETFTLKSLMSNNEAYRIQSGTNKEIFLVENRQQEKWDQYLPGHGMLVWRIDSTSTYPYATNSLNTSKHSYVQLIRANTPRTGLFTPVSNQDAFPGKANVTFLGDNTFPAHLTSYAGASSGCSIRDIKEENGVISFKLDEGEFELDKETFNQIATFAEDKNDVEGEFTQWDFVNTYVKSYLAGGLPGERNNRAVAFFRKSMSGNKLISHSLGNRYISEIVFTLENTSSSKATIKSFVEDAEGNKQVSISTSLSAEGSTVVRLAGDKPFDKDSRLTVNLTAGSKDEPVYLDNLYVYYTDYEPTAIESIAVESAKSNDCYNLSGQRVAADYKGIVIRNGKKYLNK